MPVRQPGYIANFDSATAMVRALANYLAGKDFPLLGTQPKGGALGMKLLASAVNWMPRYVKEQVYIWSGWREAIAPRKLHTAKTDRIAEWTVSLYPQRQYPAIALGSSNGALVHLFAALGIPWLPQTFLVPVARSGVHPDEPCQNVRWAAEPARVFLQANPDIQLHHMHDANQDRLMLQRMTYFRVKKLRLGDAYERFLRQALAPGGTIFIVECTLQWPTTQYDERYIFQAGAPGGATVDEYFQGSARVEEYLRRYKSHRKRWEPPPPDAERPEAEWGFAPVLREDIEWFAQRHGFRVQRIVFAQPEHMSPLVADLYQWWHHQRGVLGRRLLVESFIVMEPFWATRTGSVPFWMLFNTLPSAASLEAYLAEREPFDDIYMMLFSHGVESVGLTPIERWRKLLGRARARGTFVGVDAQAYPRDFAVFVRYYFDVQRQITSRYPMPAALPLEQLEAFLTQTQGRYQVQWLASGG